MHQPGRTASFMHRCREEVASQENQQDENRRQREFDEIAGEKTNWTLQRQKFRLT